jgi:hypothetical protein
MDRTKTDFPDAYAILAPLGSEESGVGCPLVVVGAAAQMASVSRQCTCTPMRTEGDSVHLPETRDM